jgi:hypothetical protein
MTFTDRVNWNMRNIEAERTLHFSFPYKLLVWWMARRRGPTLTGEPLPLGVLDPGIAQIAHRLDQKMHVAAQLWASEASSLGLTIRATHLKLVAAEAELVKRGEDLAKQRDFFQRDYGREAPTGFGPAEILHWVLLAFFALSEMALLSAAINLLPGIADWERLVATAGASVLNIALATMEGHWARKRGRTLGETVICVLVAVFLAIFVCIAGEMRSRAARQPNQQSAPASDVLTN